MHPAPSNSSEVTHWLPPLRNSLKMNVDLSVDEKVGFIGIGVVIRDSNDQVRGAMTSKKEERFNAYLAECLALREETSFALLLRID
ncbi:hypothetical protein PanWU01x14_196770 [Parasponia andersonii]|uniref:RNase H type-1 domain-containing protein n=1 Tax=Parasponia andersonii TaxID=3476 RepID=A0A2P5BZ99_PARAD|nr:hypothetical protein PanWU01x14_196770 [Parasponia andersonii]